MPLPVAESVTLVFVQVNGPSLVAVTDGVVIFWVTVVDDAAVQPFDDVTVTVYVPGVVTTFVDEVPPPDQT